MKGIRVYEITLDMFDSMSMLQAWQCTSLGLGQTIEAHEHAGFDAMYFTCGVNKLFSGEEKLLLPKVAAVFVERGTMHAWSGVKSGAESAMVGHFH